ncbi:MAG: hypothetical protein ACLRIO_00125 [Butyricicoccus sp.]
MLHLIVPVRAAAEISDNVHRPSLPSKTDKTFLEIFMNANLSSKTGAYSLKFGCALRFVLMVPILNFLRRRCRNKQRICWGKSSPAGNFPVTLTAFLQRLDIFLYFLLSGRF